MTDEELSLLRACAADHENDLPRLIYADRLEETGGERPPLRCLDLWASVRVSATAMASMP